jgi:hypothetical protein
MQLLHFVMLKCRVCHEKWNGTSLAFLLASYGILNSDSALGSEVTSASLKIINQLRQSLIINYCFQWIKMMRIHITFKMD